MSVCHVMKTYEATQSRPLPLQPPWPTVTYYGWHLS